MNGRMDFYRTWTEYRAGFGNLTEEFWLGKPNTAFSYRLILFFLQVNHSNLYFGYFRKRRSLQPD